MCREFHCECCPDDLPQISCECEGCSHDDEPIKAAGHDTEGQSDNLEREKMESPLDHLLDNSEEGDSCNRVTNQVDEVEAPSCCKGEIGKNECCAQDLVQTNKEGAVSSSDERGATNTKDQNPLDTKTKSCCQNDVEKPCCPSTKRSDSSGKTCKESCSEGNEKGAEMESSCCQNEKEPSCGQKVPCSCCQSSVEEGKTSCCAQKQPICPTTKQVDSIANTCTKGSCQGSVEAGGTTQTTNCCGKTNSSKRNQVDTCAETSCCQSSVEAEKEAQIPSCCTQNTPYCPSNMSPCLKEKDQSSCCSKPQSDCSTSEPKSSVDDDGEVLQPTCCSRDTPSKENEQSISISKSCCSSGTSGNMQPLSLEDQNQPTCCIEDQDDKCCQKENEGECGSTEVEVSCCKVNEETVLLIEPSEEPLTPPNASAALKTKAPLVRRHTTKLRVQNICCAMEAQLVQECLKPLEGVENVAVNVIGRVVHVRHDPDVTSPTELVESLNRVHLGATVMEMGAHHDKDNDNIPYHLKLLFIYVLIQTCLLITSVAGLFLKHPWYMWVAITEIVFGGAPILKRAFFSVKNRKIDINILMLIAIIGTLAISEWIEGATVVYVFAFADALQEFCMFRVQRTISGLMLKRPEVAVLVETGESVPIENVAVGTLIAVRPGELIPLDGVVVKGKAAVDESSITGESLPVEKAVFSNVYSGTVNQNGYIEVETTSDSSSSTVSKVAQMVQEAQSSSTKTEEIINRFAKYYTPLVVIIAALVVVVPAILGASGVGNYLQDIREWGRRALVMLVIACPCALVMATPIAVVCSITAAARKGVLVKGGEYLETISKITVLAFDKTGTLTEGKFQVMNMECAYGENEREVLRFAAGLESKSVHPIAAAIVNEFSGCVAEMVKNQIVTLPEISQFKMYEGQGISGVIEGKFVRVGNKEMVDQCGASLNESMAEKYKLWSGESKTVVFVCVDEKLSLMIALADAIRPNTSISLDWLRNIGVQTSMITGDNSRTAEAVSRNLGLDECISEMKPNEKLEWIQQKQNSKEVERQSRKCCRWSRDEHLMVGMVGDGVNDGPALASANVGIAMGAGGTALAVEAADVALMSNNLAKIPELITLAKFCNQVVKQNIVFSVLLKIVIVIVALSGYVTLWMAVVADVVGLLFVIINGLRPLMWKASKTHTKGNIDIELGLKKRVKNVYTYETIV